MSDFKVVSLLNPIQLGILALGAGTQTQTAGVVVFSNSNNVSFGMSNGVVTASAAAGGAGDGGNVLAAGTQTANSTGTVVFLNSNNFTFGLSNSSQLTASFSESRVAFSADASSTFNTLSFQNFNGISFSNNGGAVRLQHELQYTSNTSNITSNALNTLPHNSQFHSGNIIPAAVQDFGNFQYELGTAAPASSGGRIGVYGFIEQGVYRLGKIDPTNDTDVIGQDTHIIVRNNTGATLNPGQVVYITGSIGQEPTVSLARADSRNTMPAIGIVDQVITNNSFGKVQIGGIVVNLDTSAFLEGDSLFVSPTTAGGLVNTPPAYPNVSQRVGVCTNANPSNGKILILLDDGDLAGIPAISASGGTIIGPSPVSFSDANGVSFGIAGSTITASVVVGGGGFSGGVSTGGNTLGNTGTQTGQIVFAGGNNITLSVSTAAGGAQTITISGPNAGGAQTGISGIGVSDTTYSSGTIVFSNAGNITLSSSVNGATQYVRMSGNAAQTNVAFSADASSTFQTLTLQNSNGISFSNNAGAVRITHDLQYTSNTSNITSNALNTSVSRVAVLNGSSGTMSFAVGSSLSASSNASTITFGLASNITTALQSAGAYLTTAAQSNQVVNSLNASTGQMSLVVGSSLSASSNASTITFGLASNITTALQSAGAYLTTAAQSNQVVNSLNASTGQMSLVVGSSLSASSNASTITFGLASNITTALQSANANYLTSQSNQAFSASGGSSAFQTLIFTNSNGITWTNTGGSVAITHDLQFTSNTSNITSNALNTSASRVINIIAATNNTGGGTASLSSNVSFSAANGLTFYTSAGNAIVASYTVPSVPAQTNQTLSLVAASNTTGNVSSMTVDARSLTLQGMGIASVGYSTSAGGSSIIISVPSGGGAADGFNQAGFTNSTANSTMSLVWAGNSAGSGNITLGLTGSTVTGSAPSGGGGVAIAASNTTFTSGTVVMSVSAGAMTIGSAAQSVMFSVPATSSLSATGQVSIASAGSTISIGVPLNEASWWQPEVWGNTLTSAHAQGTVYFRPMELNNMVDVDKVILLQSLASSSTTASFSASVSSQTSTGGTGTWGHSGTVMLWSRVNTNETHASFDSIQTFFSKSYSIGAGYTAAVSWSTNVSSCTVSISTTGAISFISQIGSDGGITTTVSSSSTTTSFSSTSTNQNSFSSSFVLSFPYAHFSGIRPIFIGMGTDVPPGQYWFAHLQSTNTGSTNYSLQRNAVGSSPGLLYFTGSTNNYLELGNSVAMTTSNYRKGFGSYSASTNTNAAIALSQISLMASNASLWFALDGVQKP